MVKKKGVKSLKISKKDVVKKDVNARNLIGLFAIIGFIVLLGLIFFVFSDGKTGDDGNLEDLPVRPTNSDSDFESIIVDGVELFKPDDSGFISGGGSGGSSNGGSGGSSKDNELEEENKEGENDKDSEEKEELDFGDNDGLNYSNKDVCVDKKGEFEDYCDSNGFLREFVYITVDGEDSCWFKYVDCSSFGNFVCSEGICVEQEVVDQQEENECNSVCVDVGYLSGRGPGVDCLVGEDGFIYENLECCCTPVEPEHSDGGIDCVYTDSDGGYDKFNKGACDDKGSVIYTDYCDGEALVEYWLGEGDECFDGCQGGTTQFYCPSMGADWTCEDGACVQSDDNIGSCESTCNNLGFFGYMVIETENECHQFADENDLDYGTGGYVIGGNSDNDCCCYSTGNEGACTNEDSDPQDDGNTWNILEKGTCSDGEGDYEDYCVDGIHLREYYLNSGEAGCFAGCKYTDPAWDCTSLGDDYVCENGRCVEEIVGCPGYCLEISDGSRIYDFSGGSCESYDEHGSLSREMVCSNNGAEYIEGGDGTCSRVGTNICCCR